MTLMTSRKGKRYEGEKALYNYKTSITLSLTRKGKKTFHLASRTIHSVAWQKYLDTISTLLPDFTYHFSKI